MRYIALVCYVVAATTPYNLTNLYDKRNDNVTSENTGQTERSMSDNSQDIVECKEVPKSNNKIIAGYSSNVINNLILEYSEATESEHCGTIINIGKTYKCKDKTCSSWTHYVKGRISKLNKTMTSTDMKISFESDPYTTYEKEYDDLYGYESDDMSHHVFVGSPLDCDNLYIDYVESRDFSFPETCSLPNINKIQQGGMCGMYGNTCPVIISTNVNEHTKSLCGSMVNMSKDKEICFGHECELRKVKVLGMIYDVRNINPRVRFKYYLPKMVLAKFQRAHADESSLLEDNLLPEKKKYVKDIVIERASLSKMKVVPSMQMDLVYKVETSADCCGVALCAENPFFPSMGLYSPLLTKIDKKQCGRKLRMKTTIIIANQMIGVQIKSVVAGETTKPYFKYQLASYHLEKYLKPTVAPTNDQLLQLSAPNWIHRSSFYDLKPTNETCKNYNKTVPDQPSSSNARSGNIDSTTSNSGGPSTADSSSEDSTEEKSDDSDGTTVDGESKGSTSAGAIVAGILCGITAVGCLGYGGYYYYTSNSSLASAKIIGNETDEALQNNAEVESAINRKV